MEAEAARQAAAGTGDCFGASAATRLRKRITATQSSSSSSRVLRHESIWLCFPCMQKRGEESQRVDNDFTKHKCKYCSDCPVGIYELVATPGSEATSSTQTFELPSGRRTYAPILRRADVSVNLQMYFATRDNEPVALTALEAGGGGDCLFHSIAAIAEQILFERPNSRTYFEPHLKLRISSRVERTWSVNYDKL